MYVFVDVGGTSSFGSYVGLGISQSLILTGMVMHGVKQTTDVQSQMTAVERVLQYTDLPKESSRTTDNPPPPGWPHSGRVVMKNVFLRYNPEDPPVLKVRRSIGRINPLRHRRPPQSHLHSVCFLFYERLMIDFETVLCFLDPLDSNWCKLTSIIHKFLKLLLLIIMPHIKYHFF